MAWFSLKLSSSNNSPFYMSRSSECFIVFHEPCLTLLTCCRFLEMRRYSKNPRIRTPILAVQADLVLI